VKPDGAPLARECRCRPGAPAANGCDEAEGYFDFAATSLAAFSMEGGHRLRLRHIDRVAAGDLRHRRAARFDMLACAGGGISCPPSKPGYQLGLVLQAGSVIRPASVPRPTGLGSSP